VGCRLTQLIASGEDSFTEAPQEEMLRLRRYGLSHEEYVEVLEEAMALYRR
jgi:hypothetical protein